MAKKKNTQKKHKFKHVEATELSAAPAAASSSSAVPASASKPLRPAVAMAGGRDHRYVGGDLRRIGIAAVILVALELVLYYVLTMTSAGAAIYNLVQV